MAEVSFACLYFSYGDTFAPFTDAERGRIMMAMIQYASTGEIPNFEGNERFIWPTVQAQIDRDIAAYEKRCEKNRANGAKGGRPKKQTDIEETQKTERFSAEPKKANNNDNYKDNDKEKDKGKGNITDSSESEPKKPVKHKHGEYNNVLLTDEELDKLKTEYPDWEDRIERLSSYVASTGKSYKSHYATIRNWARKDQKEGRNNGVGADNSNTNKPRIGHYI